MIDKIMIFYEADTNRVRIPIDDMLRARLRTVGTVARLDVPGSPFQRYLQYIGVLAVEIFERGGRLKIAPPYGAWLRRHD